MLFNQRSNLVGLHAFLSASSYHWVNYDLDKLDLTYATQSAAKRGTQLHELANMAIKLKTKMQGKNTLAMYVNDAIGFKMTPEQPLFVTENCFGTADAICFRGRTLRIHDLKTGITPASFMQLLVYCAMFCLEYNKKPFEIEMLLRIYQNDEITEMTGDPDEVTHIMETILRFDKRIRELKEVED